MVEKEGVLSESGRNQQRHFSYYRNERDVEGGARMSCRMRFGEMSVVGIVFVRMSWRIRSSARFIAINLTRRPGATSTVV
jgi:hypothetical protein